MRTFYISLLVILFSSNCFSQGTIMSLEVSPANPTVNDNIELYANVSFTSGDCQLEESSFGISGSTVTATAHHCVGLLTVICPTIDTFQIGQLAAGNYTFDFTLTSGFGGPNCTPGIVADGNEQLQFTVSPAVGIKEETNDNLEVFPNPLERILNFSKPIAEAATICKEVVYIPATSTRINVEYLPPGTYILKYETQRLKLLKH